MFNRAIFLMLFAVFCLAIKSEAKEITLGFDGLPEWAIDVGEFGVQVTGAAVLTCGSSLNCGPFPPFSGMNVIYDHVDGKIIATFDPVKASKVDKVSARITGNTNIVMTAYSEDKQIIGVTETGGANYVGSDTGLSANLLLEIESKDTPIHEVIFDDHGNSFTLDDLYFRSNAQKVCLDPGHGTILTGGVYKYQRAPSPTFGIIEDIIVLDIAQSAKIKLVSMGYEVIMTREGDKAPFAPENCGVPCTIDTLKRAEWAEKRETDILVSIHTNGANIATAHGTVTFYSSSGKKGSKSLAGSLHSQVVSCGGFKDRGVKQKNVSNIILTPNIVSALVEVAFHSNSELDADQTMTDEEFLSDAMNRSLAGQAVAEGTNDYIKSIQ